MNEEKFYFAVDDVTIYKGTINNYHRRYKNWSRGVEFDSDKDEDTGKYDFRTYSPTFSKTPERAIIKAVFDTSRDIWKDEDSWTCEATTELFKNMFIDPKTKCYVYYEFFTTGSELPPKKIHMDKFLAGEYELYIYKHEIQVFSSVAERLTDEVRLRKNKDILKNPKLPKTLCDCLKNDILNYSIKPNKNSKITFDKNCVNKCCSCRDSLDLDIKNNKAFTVNSNDNTKFEVSKEPIQILITVK